MDVLQMSSISRSKDTLYVFIEDPTVGVVIWEYKDQLLLGKPSDKPLEDVSRVRVKDTLPDTYPLLCFARRRR